MRIVWLGKALRDINSIETYIAKDNPVAARHVTHQIREVASLLDGQPLIGRPGRVHDTRELIVPGTPYIIAYAIIAKEIFVLSVTHGARKWPEPLG